MEKIGWRCIAGRLLIGVVLLFNVQCAVVFLVAPDRYAPGFELRGVVGSGIIRGIGILFLMWNVPYAAAFLDPARQRSALFEAVIMQAIGFSGETILWATFPSGHPVIQATLLRFILFDGAGLLSLLFAVWLTRLLPVKRALPGSAGEFPSGKT